MILGITGSFGAGKSTVREEFSALDWHYFDADEVCHLIYASSEGEFFNRITGVWGKEILSPQGSIDRKKLAEKVFGNPQELKMLTDILYPELERRLVQEIGYCRKNNISGAFEIPLLFENGYGKFFDAVLTVWGSPEVRHKRLREMRHFSDGEIRRREAQQLPSDEKLEKADFALVNNGSKELLKKQILELVNKISPAKE